MRPLIAGNWKMNGVHASLEEIRAVARSISDVPSHAEVLICPPFTLVAGAVAAAAGNVEIGGQDCHREPCGAFTGDVSAEMLADAGASTVIVGHSERRQLHGETDAIVESKVKAAWRAGLRAILCIGESAAQHDAGEARGVVLSQLAGSLPHGATAKTLAIAYEPVWAIGSGRTPSTDQITAMHAHIHAGLEEAIGSKARDIRVLYGGSVKPGNARTILALPSVDGVLVGGASLVAHDFLEIIRSVPGQ